MPALRRSAIWDDPRVQPLPGEAELDLDHPLGRGMVLTLVGVDGNFLRDYGPRQNTSAPVNAPTRVAALGGLAYNYNGSSQRHLTIKAKTADLTGALTVAQKVQPRGSFANHRNSIFRGDGVAGQFGIIAFADGHWESESGAGLNGGTLTLNKDFSLAYALPAAGGTLVTYQNGRPGASGARTAAFKDNECTIGADVVNSRFWNGLIYYTYLYNRGLTAGEVEWLHAEPYAMFRPIVRRRVSLPGMEASVGIDVSLSGALTTGIPLAATIGVNVGVSGALTTVIQLVADIGIDVGVTAPGELFTAKVAKRLDDCGHPIFTRCGDAWITKKVEGRDE